MTGTQPNAVACSFRPCLRGNEIAFPENFVVGLRATIYDWYSVMFRFQVPLPLFSGKNGRACSPLFSPAFERGGLYIGSGPVFRQRAASFSARFPLPETEPETLQRRFFRAREFLRTK